MKNDPCTHCQGTVFGLAPDGDAYLEFCFSDECLTADSEASKEFVRKRWGESLHKPTRNRTGAEIFNIGLIYKNACLANWIAPDATQIAVNQWINNEFNMFTVMGSPGTGKTYLCAALVNYFTNQNKEVFYTSHRRLMNTIQTAISQNIPQHTAIKPFAEKEILIFDDLGAGTNTEWQSEMILELIDIRYSMKRPTLITTNLFEDDLVEQLGERTYSRLKSKENKILIINIPDIRQENIS